MELVETNREGERSITIVTCSGHQTLDTGTMDSSTLGVFLGSGICALLGSQLALLVLRSAQSYRAEWKQFQLRHRVLQTQLESLQAKQKQALSTVDAWQGLRKFRVERKVTESDDVVSLYLKPHDGKRLAAFRAGQYLTFSIPLRKHDKPLIRCYSLSDRPNADYYRISVRKVLPDVAQPDGPPGRISSYFVDEIQPGDIVDVHAPRGNFTWEVQQQRPVVMLAAGIGITPLLSMLHAMRTVKLRHEVHVLVSMRSSAEHPFKDEMEVFRQDDRFRVEVFYTQPRTGDEMGRDYDHRGRITVPRIRELLGASNYQYLMCGPADFMRSMAMGLEAWGVPPDDIRSEAFGASSTQVGRNKVSQPPPHEWEVRFAKSNQSVMWDGSHASLLECGEVADVVLESGCRAGSCGACVLAVKSGKVVYPNDSGVEVEEGSCLPCIGVPDGALVLDA